MLLMREIILPPSLSSWMISLIMLSSSYTYITANCKVLYFICVAVFHYLGISQFLICFSIIGHLHCFYILAIIVSAAMNTVVHISFQMKGVFFCALECQEVLLLGHVRVLFFLFKKISVLISIVTEPVDIPTNNEWCPLSPYSHQQYFQTVWYMPFSIVWGSILLLSWFASS